MSVPRQMVISASRRTDIPAFYMEWFMSRIEKGFFETVNPFNRRVTRLPATPDRVHTIVFWSKNFRPFIEGRYGKALRRLGYKLFFNFTINSESRRLEPNIPPLADRLDQLDRLCREFDPAAVNWRFDPVCFFREPDGRVDNNLKDFADIADAAGSCGIRRCITSFMDEYPKIHKRVAALPGFAFIDPPLARKTAVIEKMCHRLTAGGIRLQLCCEQEILNALPQRAGITKSACIPGDLLAHLFGGGLSLKKDAGQRIKLGCGCSVSADIGVYHLHKCYHNCLFCYANPAKGPDPGSRLQAL